jgi:apolipoprotein N-acyltransferase
MRRFDAVFLSAVLYFLSFPAAFYSANLVPAKLSAVVVWFAFVPLLVALRGASPSTTFRWAYLFGFLSNLGIFFWVIIAMQKYGGLSVWISGSILLLMIVILAFYPAVSLWCAARLRSRAPVWATGPLLCTLLEWSRVYFPAGGFPWATPAYGLAGSLPLVQVADVVGTAGLNLFIFAVNFQLAEWIARRREGRSLPWAGIGTSAVLLLAVATYGWIRIAAEGSPAKAEGKIRVALLQGNIPQDLKWDPDEKDRILANYRQLTRAARESDPDLVIWPEAALPFTLSRDIQSIPFVSEFLGRSDLLAGAPTASGEKDALTFRNSAFVLSSDGRVRFRYDKQHLVPFGEYVPLSGFLPMRYIVPAVAGNFTSGAAQPLAKLGSQSYGILICYELLFPDLTLDWVRRGAHFLVNITNDAWFDQTSGPFQHVHFGIFRAVETRRFVVRAANTGITTWFDRTGRMHTPTDLFTRGFVIADISPSDEVTFYVRFPHMVPLAALILLALSLLRIRRKDA